MMMEGGPICTRGVRLMNGTHWRCAPGERNSFAARTCWLFLRWTGWSYIDPTCGTGSRPAALFLIFCFLLPVAVRSVCSHL